jgi:uncharacterized membrane protein YdjX (TVP38/TMEM64 family)
VLFFRTVVSRLILKLLTAAFAVALVACLAHYFPVFTAVQNSCHWIGELGLLGLGLLAALLALGSLCFLPASPFVVTAAAVFGFWPGVLASCVGIALGAAGGFILSRVFLRRDIAAQLRKHPTFRAIDIAIEQEGWKIVVLLRLCPIPFGLANYLYGLTGVPFSQYLLTSLIGSLPGILLFCHLGNTGKTSLDAMLSGHFASNSMGPLILLGLSVLATVILIFFLPRFARRAIAKYANVTIPS